MSLRYARANKLFYDKVISLFLVFVFHLYISLYTVFFFKALVLTTLNYLFFSFEFSLQACCNFYMFLHQYIFKADYVSLQHVLIFNMSHLLFLFLLFIDACFSILNLFCCCLGIARLLENGSYTAAYPIHEVW